MKPYSNFTLDARPAVPKMYPWSWESLLASQNILGQPQIWRFHLHIHLVLQLHRQFFRLASNWTMKMVSLECNFSQYMSIYLIFTEDIDYSMWPRQTSQPHRHEWLQAHFCQQNRAWTPMLLGSSSILRRHYPGTTLHVPRKYLKYIRFACFYEKLEFDSEEPFDSVDRMLKASSRHCFETISLPAFHMYIYILRYAQFNCWQCATWINAKNI